MGVGDDQTTKRAMSDAWKIAVEVAGVALAVGWGEGEKSLTDGNGDDDDDDDGGWRRPGVAIGHSGGKEAALTATMPG
jgi:hypothetical protein